MRSNWEIHCRVPCRAWQHLGWGWARAGKGSTVRLRSGNSTACPGHSLQPAPRSAASAGQGSLPLWDLPALTWGCAAGNSHPVSDPAVLWAFLCWASSELASPLPAQKASLHSPGTSPWEGESVSLIGISVSFRPCLLGKLISTSVPHQTLAVLLGLEVCSSVWIKGKGRKPEGFLLQT